MYTHTRDHFIILTSNVSFHVFLATRENLDVVVNICIPNSLFKVDLRENKYLKRESITDQRMIHHLSTHTLIKRTSSLIISAMTAAESGN